MRLDEILSDIPICPRENCGYKIFCHRSTARSQEEFGRVPHEIAAVLPERWFCLPYIVNIGNHNTVFECDHLVSTSIVEEWLTGGLFSALAQLEENGFACLSVDVHYPDPRRVMVLYNYYHLAGTLAALVAEYQGPVGMLHTSLVTDEARRAIRFLKSWRKRFRNRRRVQNAPFSQSIAVTVSHRGF